MDNKQYGDELFIYAMVLMEEAEMEGEEGREDDQDRVVPDNPIKEEDSYVV